MERERREKRAWLASRFLLSPYGSGCTEVLVLVLVLVLYGGRGDSSVKSSQQKIAEHQMAIALVPSKKGRKDSHRSKL